MVCFIMEWFMDILMVQVFLQKVFLLNKDMKDPLLSKRIAARMAQWHSLEVPEQVEPMIEIHLKKWIKLLVELYPEPTSAVHPEKLQEEADRLLEFMVGVGSPIVFCHNDIQTGNIIFNHETGTISLSR